MGLYLLSVISAHDSGYLTIPNVLERLENTLDTFDKLERRHGHFCNWYDTQTLQPLPPLYLSTVDSGNLLACLLVLRQALKEKKQTPITSALVQEGLEDTLGLLAEALSVVDSKKASSSVNTIKALEHDLHLLTRELRTRPKGMEATRDWLEKIGALAKSLPVLIERFGHEIDEPPEELARWTTLFVKQIGERQAELDAAAPWLPLLASAPDESSLARYAAWPELKRHLEEKETPASLATSELQESLDARSIKKWRRVRRPMNRRAPGWRS